VATARTSFEVEPAPLFASMLEDLHQAHRRLFGEMANMDALTQQPNVEWPSLCAARWRISEASLARRSLAARITDHLLLRADGADAAALKSLQAADQSMLRTSARHVSAWPIGAIQGDWRGYCRASRELRAQMEEFLRTEQRVLLPILQRASASRPLRDVRALADPRIALRR